MGIHVVLVLGTPPPPYEWLADTLSKTCLPYRARDGNSGTICALKQIKMSQEKDGFPLSSIREINVLLSLRHKNIVDVSEVVVGSKMDDVYMVMEYMEHDLKALMRSMHRPFTIAEVNHFNCLRSKFKLSLLQVYVYV